MSSATIVFFDVVGYSKKPTERQRDLINGFNAEVLHELRTVFFPPLRHPNIQALPAGDGVALAFLHNDQQRDWNFATVVSLIIRLHKWAFSHGTGDNAVELRIGVHFGPVELITDINGKPGICGGTINYAQRVMDAANARQTLFSKAALEHYVNQVSKLLPKVPGSEGFQLLLDGPHEILAKHEIQIPVHKMVAKPEQDWCSSDDPKSKFLAVVSLTEEGTPLVRQKAKLAQSAVPMVSLTEDGTPLLDGFGVRLETASQVALIQLTGSRLAESLGRELHLSKDLQRLWIFMPSPKACEQLKLFVNPPNTGLITPKLVEEATAQWKAKLLELKTVFPHADIKLGIFDAPPYFGASFLNWETAEGSIHISPYVWNSTTPECPGFDFLRRGQKPLRTYQKYVDALNYLNAETANHLH